MSVAIYNLDGEEIDKIQLPKIFSAPYNPKLIHRAAVAIESHMFVPNGTAPLAGERGSTESYNTGRGMSRISRVKSSRGTRSGVAAGVASVVRGRIAHPPVSSKTIHKKLNKKERRLAIISAISTSTNKKFVISRGHKINDSLNLPIVVVDEIESLSRSKDVLLTLRNLGLGEEIKRISKTRTRSGKSRLRGRTQKIKKGPLIICSQTSGLQSACSNLLGVDLLDVKNLNLNDIAPGTQPGRLIIWTKSSFQNIPKPLNNMVKSLA